MKLPVTYVWTHDSIGLGEDGPTHQPIEHLAALRAIPGLDVVRPADANETAVAWRTIARAHRPAGRAAADPAEPADRSTAPRYALAPRASPRAPTSWPRPAAARPRCILIGHRLRGADRAGRARARSRPRASRPASCRCRAASGSTSRTRSTADRAPARRARPGSRSRPAIAHGLARLRRRRRASVVSLEHFGASRAATTSCTSSSASPPTASVAAAHASAVARSARPKARTTGN